MRILRNCEKFSVLLFSFVSIAARVGFIAGSWVILVSRFGLNPVVSGVMSASVQGLITVMMPLSKRLFGHFKLIKCQRLGAAYGFSICLILTFTQSLYVFLVLVFLASFSKVAIEATFPRVTHSFIVDDQKFSARLMGVQQGSVLFISAIIAPIALMGSETGPMLISSILYLITFVVTILLPKCGEDTTEQNLELNAPQATYDRRFSDIVRNEDIRAKQSRIHKFRRIPSTLLTIDLSNQIIAGAGAALMPLCFLHVSKVSQGMDSTLCFVFGLFAAITGMVLIPQLLKKVVLSSKQQWIILLISSSVSLFACLFYTTYAGVGVAIISAVINGTVLVASQSVMHTMAANSLTQNQYQDFGCKLMQRNAIARVASPMLFGSLAALFSLSVAFWILMSLVVLFTSVTIARVILILNGRKLDESKFRSNGTSNLTTQTIRTNRFTRVSIYRNDSRFHGELVATRNLRQRSKQFTFNRIGSSFIIFRVATALSQKNELMDATRRTPG